MAFAEFEEKEYESLFTAAIAGHLARKNRPPQMYSPGQVLENALEFDFSFFLDPRSIEYRLLVGQFQGPPKNNTFANAINGFPATNVFLQHKRPEHFAASNRNAPYPNKEFMRFKVHDKPSAKNPNKHHQLEVLYALASNFPNAVVRYSCPTVWSRMDLYGAFFNSKLLESSIFVHPKRLRQPSGQWHDYWTFPIDTPTLGRGNPKGDIKVADTLENFLDSTNPKLSPMPNTLLEQLSTLAQQVNSISGSFDFFERQSFSFLPGGRSHKSRIKQLKSRSSRFDDIMSDTPINRGDSSNTKGATPHKFRKFKSSEKEHISDALTVASFALEMGVTWSVRA